MPFQNFVPYPSHIATNRVFAQKLSQFSTRQQCLRQSVRLLYRKHRQRSRLCDANEKKLLFSYLISYQEVIDFNWGLQISLVFDIITKSVH